MYGSLYHTFLLYNAPTRCKNTTTTKLYQQNRSNITTTLPTLLQHTKQTLPYPPLPSNLSYKATTPNLLSQV